MSICEVCESSELIGIPTHTTALGFFVRCSQCWLLQNLESIKPSEIEGSAFESYAGAQELEFERRTCAKFTRHFGLDNTNDCFDVVARS